jgi:hypothetical protein
VRLGRVIYTQNTRNFRQVALAKLKKKKKKVPVDSVAVAVSKVSLQDPSPSPQSSFEGSPTTQAGSGATANLSVPTMTSPRVGDVSRDDKTGGTDIPQGVPEVVTSDVANKPQNQVDHSAIRARIAEIKTELKALQAVESARVAKEKAAKRAEKKKVFMEHIALANSRKTAGLRPVTPVPAEMAGWPDYCRKDKRMLITRKHIARFFDEVGFPPHFAVDGSWGTLTNIYAAILLGLYGSGVIAGIDARLDRSFFSLSKSMRQVMDYLSWQVPALAQWLQEDYDGRFMSLLRNPPSKYLASVSLVTAPTAATPEPILTRKKDRSGRYGASAKKADLGRRRSNASSSKGDTVTADTGIAWPKSVAPLVETVEDTTSPAAESMETDHSPVEQEEVSKSSEAKTGEGTARPSAVGAKESAAGAAYKSVDKRGEMDLFAREMEKSHCTAKNWVLDMVQVGVEAQSKLHYTILRASLKSRLEKERCLPLRPHMVWSYAREVMENILPSQRDAGHYKPLNNNRTAQRKNKPSSVRQSATHSARVAQPTSAPRSGQQGRDRQHRVTEDQDGFQKQGRPRKHQANPRKQHTRPQGPSPRKGSSSSARRR